MRQTIVERKTKETEIRVELSLDGRGEHEVSTGIGFFDHMLGHVALHGLFDLRLRAKGDLHVDPHHTVEDCALALGQALDQVLGDRAGIARIGHAVVPMDETLAQVTVDLSGRPFCVFEAYFQTPTIGGLQTTLVGHVFQSLSVAARANVHAKVLYGQDDHHQAEALFKALGRALSAAVAEDPRRAGRVPSTKGTL
ncbi:MAG: imidazoleglycerol-phosphate dehydratase HisB [Deltaproteobacteria bacterium]|nr:imidazoleglycerol-phosphate dehydratase HisB [Deltaproteobacteria bacterium]